ncbi:MAG: rhodanese-related sulfurtransferase [Candidatus Babeliales bacterium]
MNKILLFYKYIDITYPGKIREWQRTLCESLNLKGRILIAHEGINGTIGGSPTDIEKYIIEMEKSELFHDVDFKESYAQGESFPKLKVKVRAEIVRLGVDPEKIHAKNGGKHLTPEEVHALIEKKPDNLVILDARNTFEAKVGKFNEAIVPDIEYFRDLPKFLDEHEELFKDKQVLMYCTGGIRCERASAYLKTKNVAKDVYQLEGGIHRYIEKYPDGFFRGKNYVFDGRVSVRVNDDVLSTCEQCNKSCDEYTNCVNAECNKHCILCVTCIKALENTCSTACLKKVQAQEVIMRTIPAKTSEALNTKKGS